ncbi:DUF4431 domain-containing protein [Roseateles flavus]|uniref:DUF4431 domain-containing protein n=1 Tax=Roseateles flavus TaxID=3149041 RepID=A0ABV0G8A7_9BURK
MNIFVRNPFSRRRFAGLALALCVVPAALAATPDASELSSSCLSYDSTSTKLIGTLLSRPYYGPPNYGETPSTDSRERAFLLLLDAPICVTASAHPEKDNNSFERDQIVVHLAPSHVKPKEVARMLGRQVTATGQLYHAFTGHHRTPVLLDVYGIEAR